MAGGYTIVKYGGVTMYRVITEDVNQEQVFDDSRTDQIYVKTTISLSGYIHGHSDWLYQMQADNSGNSYDGLASLAAIQFRQRLPPRQTFQMYMGCSGDGQIADGELLFNVQAASVGMIPAPGPDASDDEGTIGAAEDGNIDLTRIDVNNGPKNLSFKIQQVAGDELYRVSAVFELCHLECYCEGCENTYGVLSNRWSISDSLDTDLMTTRTYSGTLVCASANISINSLRWLTVPPIQPLMRIESMNFTVSPDGLKLNWMYVHKEVASAAPWPARTWSVVHTEEQIDGMNQFSYLDVDLTAGSKVDKAELIELAYWIIFAKLYGRTPDQVRAAIEAGGVGVTAQVLIKNISITDYIGDKNRISAKVKAWRPVTIGNPAAGVGALAGAVIAAANNGNAMVPAIGIIGFDTLGVPITASNLPTDFADDPPPYEQYYSWGAYPGQTPEFEGPCVLAGIFACYLQEPCNDIHGMYVPDAPIRNPSNAPDQNATTLDGQPQVIPATVSVSTEFGETTPYYSDSQNEAMYTFWQIDNVYKMNAMVSQMPIANTPGTPNYNNTSTFVQLSGTQARRIIRVTAERVGEEAELPDPSNLPAFPLSGLSGAQGIGQKFLRMILKPGTATVTALGQLVFRVSAEYHIGLSRAPNPGEQLAIGNDKWNILGNQSTSPSGNLTGGEPGGPSNWE